MQDPDLSGARAVEGGEALEGGPDEERELRGKVEDKEAVIALADAIAEPGAVVVESAHAAAAVVAVLAAQRLPDAAVGAGAAGVGGREPAVRARVRVRVLR